MFDVTPMTSPKQTDCGATCLQMMLHYYGTDVDLDTLIEDCNTKIYGCTAKDIKNAGIKHGLDMKAYSMKSEELFLTDRPAIIWWKDNHFCVYCGLNEEGKAVICNPDRGRYGLSKGIFTAFYGEVALFNGEPDDLTEPVTIFDKVKALEEQLNAMQIRLNQIDEHQYEVVKPSFDAENPIDWVEGMTPVNNAFYRKDGKVYVWMNEWVEWD